MTRCKVGDLAVLVRSVAGNEGKLFTVLSWVGKYRFLEGSLHSDVWLVQVEQSLRTRNQQWRLGEKRHVRDACLRPIRPHGDCERDTYLDRLPSVEQTRRREEMDSLLKAADRLRTKERA